MERGVEREVPSPRVVLPGARGLRFVHLRLLLIVGLPLAVALPVGLATWAGPNAASPRLGPLGPVVLSSWRDVVLLASVVAGVVAFALDRWARPRRRTVEVFADRLVLGDVKTAPGSAASAVFLADLDGFDDASSDLVRLRRRAGRWRDRVDESVRAPPGAGRAVLVDTLLAAGLRREDGGSAPTRRASGPRRPWLVVRGAPPVAETILLVVLAGAFALDRTGALAGEGPALGDPLRLLAKVSRLGVPLLLAASVALLLPRRDQVTFFDDRVVLDLRGAPRRALGWDDVVGWRGDARDHVALVLREGVLRARVREPVIPTLTPEARASVEALLTARGVPRVA